MLTIITLVLGPTGTNTYMIADEESGVCAVIDPAWDGHLIRAEAEKRGWEIGHIWLTHAHFDHLGGVAGLVDGADPPPPVALHPGDLPLYNTQGGAALFGLEIEPGPEPSVELAHGQTLYLGKSEIEVRHAPGHSPGHVMFYVSSDEVLFCGDVIFNFGIGRTDLPGGSHAMLMENIRTQVLSLPDETRLLSGHGPATTVGVERRQNPFLA